MDKKLAALAEELEAALVIDDTLSERVLDTIEHLAHKKLAKSDLESTDIILDLIHSEKPGWNISIRGNASKPNGHWRCSLRKSSIRDNDEYLGIARGPTLPHALLSCWLKSCSFEAG
ncbi:hypothetical protein [Actibacterium pelagium]|uniref:Uncharacterized protein n=1 Tax=Actibacterium pelagium TaxID=2029103 RepID=A0A917EMM8_9RHOB|nr:hypothetical protein [Actibacterium pelagium]GGE61856.1 hypothetical protein GCM10011517_31900 [Actibacterium pelagium]